MIYIKSKKYKTTSGFFFHTAMSCCWTFFLPCFYQNDSYGFAGLEGIKQALQKRDMQLVSSGSYERNTVAVMGGLREIYKAKPEAVILVGTYNCRDQFQF